MDSVSAKADVPKTRLVVAAKQRRFSMMAAPIDQQFAGNRVFTAGSSAVLKNADYLPIFEQPVAVQQPDLIREPKVGPRAR